MTDITYAIRSLRRTPGFTAIAVLTLALGIGANTAIFSLVHAVILKPLPFRDPGRLVTIWDTYLPQFDKIGISSTELRAWEQQSDLFRGTAWYRSVPFNMALSAPGAEALQVHTTFISPSLLPVLGAAPALGRAFSGHEPPASVLLSHRLWLGRFAANPAIVNQSIRLNDQEFTVAGVMPANFEFPDFADLWLPPGPLLGDAITNPVRHALGFVGRLAPGATVAQAAARLNTMARRLAAENPKTSTGWGMQVAGLQEELTRGVCPTLLMLLAAVTLVLVIACANVAGLALMLALVGVYGVMSWTVAQRTREIGIRMALGANRTQVLGMVIRYGMKLSCAGLMLGLAGAWVLRRVLAAFVFNVSPSDPPVYAAVGALMLLAAWLACYLPAVRASCVDPGTALRWE